MRRRQCEGVRVRVEGQGGAVQLLACGGVHIAGVVELAGKGPQHKGGPDGLDRPVTVFEAAVHNRGNPVGSGDAARQPGDLLCGNGRDLLEDLGPEVLHVTGKILKADSPVIGKGFVKKLLFKQHITQAQSQSAIRTRPDRQ